MLGMVSGAWTVLCKGSTSSVFLPMTPGMTRCAQGDTQSHHHEPQPAGSSGGDIR